MKRLQWLIPAIGCSFFVAQAISSTLSDVYTTKKHFLNHSTLAPDINVRFKTYTAIDRATASQFNAYTTIDRVPLYQYRIYSTSVQNKIQTRTPNWVHNQLSTNTQSKINTRRSNWASNNFSTATQSKINATMSSAGFAAYTTFDRAVIGRRAQFANMSANTLTTPIVIGNSAGLTFASPLTNYILFGTSAYDTGNNRLGIGTAVPDSAVQVKSASDTVVPVRFHNYSVLMTSSNNTNSIAEYYTGNKYLRSNLRIDGIQNWYLNTGTKEAGRVQYTTPGGGVGITFTLASSVTIHKRYQDVTYKKQAQVVNYPGLGKEDSAGTKTPIFYLLYAQPSASNGFFMSQPTGNILLGSYAATTGTVNRYTAERPLEVRGASRFGTYSSASSNTATEINTAGALSVKNWNANKALLDAALGLRYAGNTTTWDDLRVEPVSKGGAGAPEFTLSFGTTAPPTGTTPFYNYHFNDSGSLEYLYWNFQMPHSWKEGSTIYVHVHSTTDATTGNIRYQGQCNIAAINGAFSTSTFTNWSSSATLNGTAWNHTIGSGSAIDMTGKTISTVGSCNISRNTSVTGDHTGDSHLLYIDIHFQSDSTGSEDTLPPKLATP